MCWRRVKIDSVSFGRALLVYHEVYHVTCSMKVEHYALHM